jgi:hypothetical protein
LESWEAGDILVRSILSQFFIIALHQIGVPRWNRVTIDRHQRIRRLTPGQLFADSLLNLNQRFHHLQPDDSPIGFGQIALEGLAQNPRALTGAGDVIPEVGQIDHVFDIPQAVRPGAEAVACDGARLLTGGIGQKTVPIIVEIAACAATFATGSTAIPSIIGESTPTLIAPGRVATSVWVRLI